MVPEFTVTLDAFPEPIMTFRILTLTLFLPSLLGAWSPRFHEVQTALAAGLIPKAMGQMLRAHSQELFTGARGVGSDQVPTVEDVEEQFQRILRMSTERRRTPQIVRELGALARMVQLLSDPSATLGMTPLRERFEAYGNEHLNRLVVTKEPYWAIDAPYDPRPRLLELYRLKYERHHALAPHFDPEKAQPVGSWDVLSVPFAQLQLAFSTGVNATANFWILAWRAAGEHWEVPDLPADEIR